MELCDIIFKGVDPLWSKFQHLHSLDPTMETIEWFEEWGYIIHELDLGIELYYKDVDNINIKSSVGYNITDEHKWLFTKLKYGL